MKVIKSINNRGFSLVELIIVMAIMVVLVGITAPNYMRYVERKRKDADIMSIEVAMHAIEIVAEDLRFDFQPGDTLGRARLYHEYSGISFNEFAFRNGADHPQNSLIKQEILENVREWEIKSRDWYQSDVVVEGKIDANGGIRFTIRGSSANDIIAYAGWQGKVKAEQQVNAMP